MNVVDDSETCTVRVQTGEQGGREDSSIVYEKLSQEIIQLSLPGLPGWMDARSKKRNAKGRDATRTTSAYSHRRASVGI